jgi:hypothetical protein
VDTVIKAVLGPLISKPEAWVVCFDPVAQNRWIGRLTPGYYKHVRAYGYVPFLHVWLFVDANLKGIEILLAAHGDAANALASSWAAGCDIIVMPRRPHVSKSLSLAASGWCVPVVRRLIGLPWGALRPDGLFEECLRNGGKFHEHRRASSAAGNDHGAVSPGSDLHAAAN